jgi:methyl-accepting chemotaxis protein
MIENSIEKAKAGTIIAKETALALEKIVEGVKKASTLVSDIAVASNEQDLAISQINQGVMQVSEVVQENSATSEESAAASEELSNQAELLRKTVSNFKLKKSESEDDYINPEILKILEENPDGPGSEPEGDEADVPQPSAESISDTEFAKY